MNKQAKGLCGVDVGATVVCKGRRFDARLDDWVTVDRTSRITMITHKKGGSVNVRLAPSPSEGFNHQGEVQFEPNDWVEVNRD